MSQQQSEFIETMQDTFVTVQTGARLHFGPLSYEPQSGRHFGGIGMMIDRPCVKIAVGFTKDAGLVRCHSSRARQIYDRLKQQCPWGRTSVEIDVFDEIPPHCGLGSGTQMALALADALATLHGQKLSAVQLAQMAGRGERSAIGLQGYDYGGFLIDAGRRSKSDTGDLAAQLPFPEQWRILLVRPQESQGLHGEFELTAFRNLQPMSEQVTGRLCRLALTEILPAIRLKDFHSFTAAIYEYGELVGSFFSGAQNGIFSSPQIRSLAGRLPVESIGMAQSSWGPTVALFAEDATAANELWKQVKSMPEGPSLHVEMVQARNCGRSVTVQRAGSARPV